MPATKLNMEMFLERHNVAKAHEITTAIVNLVDAKRFCDQYPDQLLDLVQRTMASISLDYDQAYTVTSFVCVGPNVEIYIGCSESSDNEHVADIIVDRSEKTMFLCWVYPQVE